MCCVGHVSTCRYTYVHNSTYSHDGEIAHTHTCTVTHDTFSLSHTGTHSNVVLTHPHTHAQHTPGRLDKIASSADAFVSDFSFGASLRESRASPFLLSLRPVYTHTRAHLQAQRYMLKFSPVNLLQLLHNLPRNAYTCAHIYLHTHTSSAATAKTSLGWCCKQYMGAVRSSSCK